MSITPESEYPVWALLPKRETNVSSFLNKYPEYDGRGITVAIFDSGVDPGAPGLQVTSDGKTKIIQRYDCTGAGDIDTSTVVQPVDGVITGLTGRKLTIPPTWNNPSGSYHIGVLNSYQSYPKSLKDRIVNERRVKKWDSVASLSSAKYVANLVSANQAVENAKGNPPRTLKLQKEDAEAMVDVLAQADKKYEDLGPTYDCVLFNDGAIWRACIDTSECGDLADCKLIGEYSKTYEYAALTKEDVLNYSINVYEDGNLLEYVSMCSSHGTHVASITAAYFPDQPEKNGIAPGAQLVSLTIGDQRIDTMETGTGLIRAMIKVIESQKTENPIKVINMSYGENACWATPGRIGDMMNEVVDKYGVVFVTAAGNHGPALSTIGTPPFISTQNIIGVGAYVSPEMMVADYSLRSKTPGLPYTWSSRGPTMDGAKGVSICAPGGAITSVPQYLLRHAQLLNGTSMASPHVAGAVAILLSGLKQRNLKYTPYFLKRSLENTAHYLKDGDYYAQGHGLLQVDKAFDYLVTYNDVKDNQVRFHVYTANTKQKGVYLRTGFPDKAKDVNVTVEPVFADSTNIDSKEKLDFQMSFSLTCDKPWVHHPASLELNNLMRNINIRIDCPSLPIGLSSASIKAFDVKQPDKGPLFHVEITVVKPQVVPPYPQKPILTYPPFHFKSGDILRNFILVPRTATYAIVRLSVLDVDKHADLIIHMMQMLPKRACNANEYHKMTAGVNHESEAVHSFQVKGGVIMELVIAKYWSDQNESDIVYSVQFAGSALEVSDVVMHHARSIHQVDLLSGLYPEEVSPSITLKNNVISLKPTEAKVTPCSDRDIIPPGRHTYQLLLTYTFHIQKLTEVVPSCPLLCHYLYESEFESQLWMLFDSNKAYISSGDAYASKYSAKLEKGEYTIKLQVRHEKRDLLEKLTETPMLLSQKLHSSINLDVYSTYAAAVTQGKKLGGVTVPGNAGRVSFFIAPIQPDKMLKNVTAGQYLTGTITLAKSEHGKKVDVYPVQYVLTDVSKKSTNSSANSKNGSEKTKWEEYSDAMRDLKCQWLSKQDKAENAEKIYQELKDEYPNHLAVHSSMLQFLEPDTKRIFPGGKETEESLKAARSILKIAGLVCETVDQKSLLAHFGMKSDQRPDASTIKTDMEKQKTALVDALVRKGSVLCRLYLSQNTNGDGDNVTLDTIDSLWQSLLQYVEPNDIKSIGYFGLWHAAAFGHHGRFLKYATKMFEEKESKELQESIIWCLERADLNWLAEHIKRSTHIKFPPNYRLF